VGSESGVYTTSVGDRQYKRDSSAQEQAEKKNFNVTIFFS